MKGKTYFFSVTRYVLITSGVWYPDLENETLMKIYQFFARFFKGNWLFFVASMCLGLVLTDDEILREQNYQYVPPLIGITIKMYFLHRKDVSDIYLGIFRTEDVLVKETDTTLRKMFIKEVKYNKALMYYLMVIYGLTVFQIVFVSVYLWTQFQALVFPVNWYPFGLVKSYGLFVAVHQTLTGLYSGVIFLGLDISFVPLIIFATTRLKLLCHKFKQFKQYTKSNSMSAEDYLRLLVLEHQDIIRYIETINATLKWCFFVDFMMKSYSFTQFLYALISTIDKMNIETLFAVSKIISITTENWYINYHGNELILTSQNIAKSVYFNNWPELDLKIKKNFMLIILRSQRALQIKIGNLYAINNELFIRIMKAGYTFLLFYNV